MSKPILTLNLASFDKGGRPILGPITLQVAQGQTLALVGPSGVGKTSLLRIIAGTETQFDGKFSVHGTIATVFQEPTLLPWRNLRDNISITTGVTSKAADLMLDKVGLSGRGDDFPSQLSLGQQRRVALARAFALRPALLLLDEPFVSLDADLVQEMMQVFMKLRDESDVTSIFVTHVAAEAAQLADRTVTLGGTPSRVISDV